MSFIDEPLTPEEEATMTRLRAELNGARHPAIYVVDPNTLTVIEDYYQRIQRKRLAEWEAAGKPEDWPHHLWLTYTKTGRGVQFKGCELVLA